MYASECVSVDIMNGAYLIEAVYVGTVTPPIFLTDSAWTSSSRTVALVVEKPQRGGGVDVASGR